MVIPVASYSEVFATGLFTGVAGFSSGAVTFIGFQNQSTSTTIFGIAALLATIGVCHFLGEEYGE
jgi:hypothetical protein